MKTLNSILKVLVSIGGEMLNISLFDFFGLGIVGLALFIWSIPVFLVAGVVGSIIFVLRAYKQIKIRDEGQVPIITRMSKIELVIGGLAVVAILSFPFIGALLNTILCSFLNCGTK